MFKVIWDLKRCPVTFDFAFFLAGMDCYRQLHRPEDHVHLTIKTGHFRQASGRDKVMGEDEKQWRVKNILVDMAELLPSIKTLVVSSSPEEGTAFDYPLNPEGRFPYEAKDVTPLFRAGGNPLVFRAPTFAKRLTAIPPPYVTLTLRVSRFHPARNINLDDWYQFYKYLRGQGLTVAIVPDQEDVLGMQQFMKYDWTIYAPASLDQRLRLGLYEGALMNFGSSNGPIGATFFSNAPVMQFDQLRNGLITKELWQDTNGFEAGGQFPWSRPNQMMTWMDSTLENLVSEWSRVKPTLVG